MPNSTSWRRSRKALPPPPLPRLGQGRCALRGEGDEVLAGLRAARTRAKSARMRMLKKVFYAS